MHSLSQRTCCQRQEACIGQDTTDLHSRDAIQSHPPTSKQDLSLRSSFFTYLEYDFCHTGLWLGPLVSQRVPVQVGSMFNPTRAASGYGVAFTSALNSCCPYRFEIAIFLVKNWNRSVLSLTLHWELSLPSTIHWNSPSVKLIVRGDIEGLKKAFSTCVAHSSDALPDGVTLLHVRLDVILNKIGSNARLACCVAQSSRFGQISPPRRCECERHD